MNDEQLLRYSRHILLPQLGIEGQERLLAARALVVGAGGLGSPAAMYLASAGMGTIVLCDGDTVDLTNLQRQILHHTTSVGKPKALSGRDTLALINPEVEVIALEQRLEQKGESWEWAEIVRGLDNLQEVEALFQGKRFVMRSQVLGQAHKAFMAAGVALPPTLREKE